MLSRQGELAYRTASVQGATQIGLLRVVYGAIAADIRRAGEASNSGDIRFRCEATNHALLLLGHVESWVDDLKEENLAASLKGFYGFLRAGLMSIQSTGQKAAFDSLADLVLTVRDAWEQKERLACGSADALTVAPCDRAEAPRTGRTAAIWCA